MLDLIVSGGWLMLPIILCSVAGLGIIVERFWTLRTSQIAPANLLPEVQNWLKRGDLSRSRLDELRANSPLGEILAAGLLNARFGRDIMKESIEEAASQVVHRLGRFLNMLSTIAEIAPLLGLLGTVAGMIQVFATIFAQGNGDIEKLAGGISVALITTAAGLVVAIPAIFCHRILVKRVEEITVRMEQDAVRLVDLLHGKRAPANASEKRVSETAAHAGGAKVAKAKAGAAKPKAQPLPAETAASGKLS